SDEGSVGQGKRLESPSRSAGCTHSVQEPQWTIRTSTCTRPSSSGWASAPLNDRHLTTKALEMALKRQCPRGWVAASLRPRLHVRRQDIKQCATRGISYGSNIRM